MDDNTENIPIEVNGAKLYVQATQLGGEQQIASAGLPSFQGVTEAIKNVARSVLDALQEARPDKATVEFGMEVAVESGQLTGLLVKGSGTASLKVTLEWSNHTTS